MKAALDTLSSLDVLGKRIAVLGDMRELGEDSDKLHGEVGEYIFGKADKLFALGEDGKLLAKGAIVAGMKESDVIVVVDIDGGIDELVDMLSLTVSSGDAILFKASRALKLERIIEKLFG